MARMKRKIFYAAGVVALMVVIFFWGVYFSAGPNVVRDSEIECGRIYTALNKFHFDTGRYPTNKQGLEPLLPEYISDREAIIDTWGNPYIYEVYLKDRRVVAVRLTTYGADGVRGGEGDDEDFVYEYTFPSKR